MKKIVAALTIILALAMLPVTTIAADTPSEGTSVPLPTIEITETRLTASEMAVMGEINCCGREDFFTRYIESHSDARPGKNCYLETTIYWQCRSCGAMHRHTVIGRWHVH